MAVDFNERVLELAEDAAVPLLERVKFAAIFTSNLDEFFMIRVAGLHDQVDAGIDRPGADGRTPQQDDRRAARRASSTLTRAPDALRRARAAPALAEHGHPRSSRSTSSPASSATALDERFRRQIFPVLTPLAVGLGRPFPYISNLSLSPRRPRARPADAARRRSRA